jgi:hypothetical protein
VAQLPFPLLASPDEYIIEGVGALQKQLLEAQAEANPGASWCSRQPQALLPTRDRDMFAVKVSCSLHLGQQGRQHWAGRRQLCDCGCSSPLQVEVWHWARGLGCSRVCCRVTVEHTQP